MLVNLHLETMEPVQKALGPLRTTRGGLKSWLTQGLNRLKLLDAALSLTLTVFARIEGLISAQIEKLEICQEIPSSLRSTLVGESDSRRLPDLTETQEFIFSALTELAAFGRNRSLDCLI